jgi:hypothetical protein
MRRCYYCQAPNPDKALRCDRCERILPPPARRPLGLGAALWDWPAFRRTLLSQAPLLAFALSLGGLLTVGALREEGRFLGYHLLHGLVFAAALAWARRETGAKEWAFWVSAGLLGGLLSEALDVWYTYHGIMGLASLELWQWFGFSEDPALVYKVLQILRLGGLGLTLLAVFEATEASLARRALAPLWLLLSLALRSQVRGSWLAWTALAGGQGWIHLGLFGLSSLALAWGLGPRGPENP